MGDHQAALEHLIRDYTEPVKDPVWSNIALSAGLLKVVGLEAFQKLNGIKQLGPTYLVYPGATHTRFAHSLGVFHIARRLLLHLLTHPDSAMPPGALAPEAVKAFLCAALLHDLGHYPFAHSLKELEVAAHESLTAERIEAPELAAVLRGEVGADPRMVAAIVDPQRAHSGAPELDFYRGLLSGVLDPDKLDYLNRDAYFCGVPLGVQDVDFALAEVRAQPGGLAVTRKGLAAVESILFSKYQMYRSVYWHKTVRIATAMIKKAVLLALNAGAIEPRELYGLDDWEFFALADRGSFAPLQLLNHVSRRRLFKQVAGMSFDPSAPASARLARLQERLAFEAEIAREASLLLGRTVPQESIIIDIPEPISFEIDLPVFDREGSLAFASSDSVFSEGTVKGFARSLRRIALIAEADEELAGALEAMGGGRLLASAAGGFGS